MTFAQIQTVVLDYCNLTSTEASTRVGKAINRHYRRITSSIGMDTSRFVTRSVAMTTGQQYVTFTEIEKIDRIIDSTTATAIRLLTETSIHELRSTQPGTGEPMKWAVKLTDADDVIVLFDTVPTVAYSLEADGWTTLADLSGSNEPVFPESFHDILAWYVISEELLKKEKDKLAATYALKAESLLKDLRFHLADSPTRTTRQGSGTASGATGSGGGSGNSGGSIYTQTGLITFDRDPSAPFAVTDTSAYVANLFVEGVGNLATNKLVGRDTAGTGESEAIGVTGGLEFDGSQNIQIANLGVDTAEIAADAVTFAKMQNIATDSLIGRDAASTGDPENILLNATLSMDGAGNLQRAALTGDVTASAGSNATTIASDAVTFAKFQNITDARLLGRSAGSSGDMQEITVGTGLSLAAGALTATAASSYITLLKANSGTTTNAAAENVDTYALASGLTAKDTLLVFLDVGTVTQNTAGMQLYNSTDSVAITAGQTITTTGVAQVGHVAIRQSQLAATTVDASVWLSKMGDGTLTDGVSARSTFTTAWTGAWTLALRHGGVTAGGTCNWSWAVYKIAGQ